MVSAPAPAVLRALESQPIGRCIVHSMDGDPLAQAIVEVDGDHLVLRKMSPSGRLASAFFNQGRTEF